MQAMIPFPDLSPEIFSIAIGSFEFALRWYALAYIAGIVIAWRLAVAALRRPALWPANQPPMKPQQVEDLLTWIILGVIAWRAARLRAVLPASLLPGEPCARS